MEGKYKDMLGRDIHFRNSGSQDMEGGKSCNSVEEENSALFVMPYKEGGGGGK